MNKLQFNRRRSVAKLCPCGKSNKDGKFVPFTNYKDKGYCHSCGKTFLPELKKDYFVSSFPNTKKNGNGNKIDYLPYELIGKSLTNYEGNNFYKWLVTLFGRTVASNLCDDFCIGTSSKVPGATVFHQIDYNANLRQSKTILYNPETGKRTGTIFQAGKSILGENAIIQPCFFNEVDLRLFPEKAVAIVESEKTSVIASVFMPQFIWLATGGKNGIKWEQTKVLNGRKVILFPDLDAYQQWKQIKVPAASYTVSDFLELNASPEQKKDKLDLADFLINQCPTTKLAIKEPGYPAMWDYKQNNN